MEEEGGHEKRDEGDAAQDVHEQEVEQTHGVDFPISASEENGATAAKIPRGVRQTHILGEGRTGGQKRVVIAALRV